MGIRSAENRAMILGVDPGRDKTGWALVGKEGDLVLSGIVPSSDTEFFLEVWARPGGEWEEALAAWTRERKRFASRSESVPELEYIALGDGTGSRETARRFGRLNVKIVPVDEKGTTLEARERYWILHRPGLLQSFLPRRLRIPPRAVDDLAAWVIALRSISASVSDSDFGGAVR
jgi:RNase H-fold protein (predicted Holliday junction resolvase)